MEHTWNGPGAADFGAGGVGCHDVLAFHVFFSGGRFMDEWISNRFKMSSMFFEKNSWK